MVAVSIGQYEMTATTARLGNINVKSPGGGGGSSTSVAAVGITF
jgi:hypothetical protein